MLDDNSLKIKRIVEDIESALSDLTNWKFDGFKDMFFRINRDYGQIRNSSISASETSRGLMLFVQNKKMHLKNNS